MHSRMSVQNGDSVMLQQTVCELIDRFKSGRTNFKHGEGARLLSTSITDTKMETVRDLMLQNRRVAIDEVVHQLQISHGSAYEIIHNRLTFHKVSARRVPEQLKELHEEKRLEICKRFLDSCGAEGDHFLERIVTENETWIHHFESESKCQSMEWKHAHSPAKRKFKTHPTAGKLMLTLFGGFTRATAGTLSRERSTVHSARYSGTLCDKLKHAVRRLL